MMDRWQRGVLRGPAVVPPPLVVKLGGSLLGRPGWDRDVAALLAGLPAPRVVVAGGGPLVDGLRAVDRAAPGPVDLVHRLAIDCMGLTARLVSRALGLPLVAEPGRDSAAGVVLDAPAWLERSGRGAGLPAGWHVTSDSIAAVVAAALGGGLLLVKRVAPPHDAVARLADAGWVDGFFPTASAPLASVAWAALRHGDAPA